ncbi:MAG: patatin-like phospholipase family protein, partial [Myxococcota bacterium]
GALVAGMFAASGLDGLEAMLKTSDPAWEHRLKRWADGTPLDGFVQASINTVKRLGPLRTVLDLSSSTMNSHATSALVDSTSLQLLVDGMMELAIGDGAYPMSTTPIPYLPVGTGVFSGDQVVTFHGTVGHGARSASCLPPAYPALRLRDERLLDGALVAFVPAEELSRVGADFIVSCNVIPPDSSLFDVGELDALFDRAQTTAIRRTLEHFQGTPLPQQRSALERQMRWRYRLSWVRACMAEMAALRGALPEQLALKLKDLLFVRFIDAIHGFYLMSWKSGEDQSRLVAHCVVDMRPEEYQVFEFWRGRAIAADFDARLRAMEVAERITAIWRRPELWRGQPARTFTVTKPVATDAQPRT